MNIKKVFIIGNGFDLAHGLKTSYFDFLDSLPKDKFERNNFLYLLNHYKKHDFNMWSDFEHTYFTILNSCDNTNAIEHKFEVKISDYNSKRLHEDFEETKDLLQNHLLNEQNKFKPLDSYNKLFNLFNDESTIILDFNYTKLVSSYLNGKGYLGHHIKIHGEIFNSDNPIVFGYAANYQECRALSVKNDEFLMRNIKRLSYKLSDQKDKLEELIKSTNTAFDICILGHSCGVSDKLILNELFTDRKVRSIIPFYYNDIHEYHKTVINIDRVIHESSTSPNFDKSFNKLKFFKESVLMIQHNSTSTNIDLFSDKLKLMHSVY